MRVRTSTNVIGTVALLSTKLLSTAGRHLLSCWLKQVKFFRCFHKLTDFTVRMACLVV